MRRRRDPFPLTRHTLYLCEGDYARLQALYPQRIGAAKIIRDIVHAHIRKIEEDAAQKKPLVERLDIELEEYPNG